MLQLLNMQIRCFNIRLKLAYGFPETITDALKLGLWSYIVIVGLQCRQEALANTRFAVCRVKEQNILSGTVEHFYNFLIDHEYQIR